MAINTTHKYFIQAKFQEGVMDRVLDINLEYNCEMHLVADPEQKKDPWIEIYFNELDDIKNFIVNGCDGDYSMLMTLAENPDYNPDLLKKKALDEAIGATLNPKFQSYNS